MFPDQISREELNELPLQQYTGKVVVTARPLHFAGIIEEVRQASVVGFDTETRPSFKKGEYYPVSLVQLAIPNKVFLLRIHQSGLANEIKALLTDSAVTKVGVGTLDDIKALQKMDPTFEPSGFVDLNDTARELGVKNAGLRKLTAIFLNFRISKSQQVSNWERPELTERQVRYAATDAWACLAIYRQLQQWGYLDQH